MLALGELEQPHAQQGPPAKIKGRVGLRTHGQLDTAFALGRLQCAQVLDNERQVHRGLDHLRGFAVLFIEARAQGLVAGDERIEGALEGRAVQLPF